MCRLSLVDGGGDVHQTITNNDRAMWHNAIHYYIYLYCVLIVYFEHYKAHVVLCVYQSCHTTLLQTKTNAHKKDGFINKICENTKCKKEMCAWDMPTTIYKWVLKLMPAVHFALLNTSGMPKCCLGAFYMHFIQSQQMTIKKKFEAQNWLEKCFG